MNSYNRVSNLFVHTSVSPKGRKRKTNVLKGHINPIPLGATIRTDIKPNKLKINGFYNTFSTMDIETMDYEGEQIPVSISISSHPRGSEVTGELLMISLLLIIQWKETLN